jgi:hypothetical protein
MFPTVVTGLLATAMPEPGIIPTLVTVPLLVVLAAEVILPYASSVTVGAVYVPGTTPVVARSMPMFPEETIGELVTTILLFDTGASPTLVTVPLPPPLPPPVDEIVTFPLD